MEKEFVETLDITNVRQIKKNDGRIEIYFTVDGFNYSLTMEKREDNYETGIVCHEDTHVCLICNVKANFASTRFCRLLFKYQNALFHRLIECPSIRLEWLYLPYKEM